MLRNHDYVLVMADELLLQNTSYETTAFIFVMLYVMLCHVIF